MFNGYNETSLLTYNEYGQDREKKQENVSKWSYGHDNGVQLSQAHPNNRSQPEYWSEKPNFLGIPHVVKCNCSGCYSSSESQSYQGDSSRHRPWLSRTFPVPLNGAAESSKLPGYHQWDNVELSNQGSCFSEGGGLSPSQYLQEMGGKHSIYRHYQSRPEMNQPGVITSVKNVELAKKQKNEMTGNSLGQDSVFSGQNGTMSCNPGYDLTKRIGSNYCDQNEKYSNVASYSLDQHVSRLPVVEPFIKAVPSINQNRVPSTGHRSVRANIPQPYTDPEYNKKLYSETASPMGGDKKPRGFYQTALPKEGMETFQTEHPPPMDLKNINYPHFNINREYGNLEGAQKFYEGRGHHDYFSRNNLTEVIKRNNHSPKLDSRKDCSMGQINHLNFPDQLYGSRSNHMPKYVDTKSSCGVFYSDKKFDTVQGNSSCFPNNEDVKNENIRLSRSTLIFNDPRFADKGQNSFSYQNNPTAYRNFSRHEYPYQGYNLQGRFEHSHIPQNQSDPRTSLQEMPNFGVDQLITQGNNTHVFDPCQQPTNDKNHLQQFYGLKNPSISSHLNQVESQYLSDDKQEARKLNYLETIRSDEIAKNGAKISPLRLLRKKKFVTPRIETVLEPVVRTCESAPALDVRKFLSTWAEEEEESVAPTQMVVLDCQNIDAEQAKLLHLYETDPLRGVHLESGSIFTVKESDCIKDSIDQTVQLENSLENEPKNDVSHQQVLHAKDEISRLPSHEPENTEIMSESTIVESTQKTSPPKACKRGRSLTSQEGNRNRKKSEDGNRLDKWTEKKFDFMKRAEESKAAEIIRHEEEKKKIFERRLSLQQGKISRFVDKSEEKKQNSCLESPSEKLFEHLSPFDENSQSNSPNGSGDIPDLPTSEYRRNKFLDYSERKILVSGRSCKEESTNMEEKVQGTDSKVNTPQSPGKKEDVKLECSSPKIIFPETRKLKEEMGIQCVEMDDILKKMSEINFHAVDLKKENEGTPKKMRTTSQIKKVKKSKKSEQENEERLKMESVSVSKPTIKFSIQKSHDLKISFKVLNSSKKYEHSDEQDDRVKETEVMGNSVEDSENSTELITLKYKSIQRESPNCGLELKKNRRRFRRKQMRKSIEKTTPISKKKKSRYPPREEERDPLANDADDLNHSRKPYSDEYSASEDFQVQETLDSAKIKLTFKRHKGNFETEYKINNGTVNTKDEPEETDERTKGTDNLSDEKLGSEDKIFCEKDVELIQFEEERQVAFEVESGSDVISKEVKSESGSGDDYANLDSPERAHKNEVVEIPVSPRFPPDSQLAFSPPKSECDAHPPDKPELYESSDLIKVNSTQDDLNKNGQEQVVIIKNNTNCDEDTRSKTESEELTLNSDTETGPADAVLRKESSEDFETEKIQEISFDFIRDTNSPEIETNDAAGKTENSETPKESALEMHDDNFWNEKTNDSTNEINHSGNVDSSYDSKSEKGNEGDQEKTSLFDSLIGDQQNGRKTSCEWRNSTPSLDIGQTSDDGLLNFIDDDKCFTRYDEMKGSDLLKSPRSSQKVNEPIVLESTNESKPCVEYSGDQPPVTETSDMSNIITEENSKQTSSKGDVRDASDIKALSKPEIELEEGEIVDDDESDNNFELVDEPQTTPHFRVKEFKTNKIQRRYSLNSQNSRTHDYKESHSDINIFSKAKSCPPELKFSSETTEQNGTLDISVADIPLPPGNPPPENCFDLKKYFESNTTLPESHKLRIETTDVLGSKVSSDSCKLPDRTDVHNCQNSSPPKSSYVDILQRSSKIKFSLIKRTKFNAVAAKPEVVNGETGNNAEDTPRDFALTKHAIDGKLNISLESTVREKSRTPEPSVEGPSAVGPNPKETNLVGMKNIESTENANIEMADDMELGEKENESESVEVIDVMSFSDGNFIRDEFYECEGIPTSEDLPNGMEVEKVPDDDKFRNMMQNCLDNAKKYLNVGNLKLFSCSVDDLLELDCQLEENEREKTAAESPNHISRDVLLTSCEDSTADELSLSEKFLSGDMSMDFAPSFSSDICPEILPVDNWPYLEEEVRSSPIKSKLDEADLIPENWMCSNLSESQDTVPSYLHNHYVKNGRSGNKARRAFLPGTENGSFRRFRRRSLMADGEAFRMCSQIGMHRRKTIESFGGNLLSYAKDNNFKSEFTRFKNGVDKMENLWRNNNSLKCRLSLEKIKKNDEVRRNMSSDLECSYATGDLETSANTSFTRTPSKRKYSLDYKSSIWQPKVMLFRISKNELRKMYRHSKSQKYSESVDSKTGVEVSDNLETCLKPSFKRQKSGNDAKIKYVKPESEDNHPVAVLKEEKGNSRLPQLDSIKGSLNTSTTSDVKRKKSRFRNLHSKKKTDHITKDAKSPVQNVLLRVPELVDAESVLSEIFKDAEVSKDRVSSSQTKSSKESTGDVRETNENVNRSDSDRQATENHKSRWEIDKEKHSHNRFKEEPSKHRSHGEKSEKKDDHRDHRRERSETEEGYTSDNKHKHRERDRKELSRHGRHGRSRHTDRSPSEKKSDYKKESPRKKDKMNSSDEEKTKRGIRESIPQAQWLCQVCGFSDASERVSHIKSHPFHCQSCHLAFKTEAYFVNHLTNKHKDIRNQHHCLLCELSFDTEDQYYRHLETREHKHLESVEKNTINTLFTLLTGQPCPVLGIVEMKPEWLPNQAGTVHFYHQATPLSLALQKLREFASETYQMDERTERLGGYLKEKEKFS